MRLTNALLAVALAFMDRPATERRWGYELSKAAGVRSGVLYPILTRMHADGWITDGWENPAEIGGGRPPRRYYLLTDDGRRELGAIIGRATTDPRFAGQLRIAAEGAR